MPTHAIEGEDYGAGSGALSGERIYKDAAPATAFRQYEANAIYHGLRKIVKSQEISGDLTAGSGSADQTEGYIRLEKAMNRMARRLSSANSATILASSNSHTFALTSDVFVYVLNNDGGGPYGSGSGMYPTTANPTMNNYRMILVMNASGEDKVVGDLSSGKVAKISDKESCFFYGIPNGGATYWVPVGKSLYTSAYIAPASVSCKLHCSAGDNATPPTFNIFYKRHADQALVTLFLNRLVDAHVVADGGATGYVYISPSTGTGSLPNSILYDPNYEGVDFPLIISIAGVNTAVRAKLDNGHIEFPCAFGFGDTIFLSPFSITYPGVAI